MALLDELRHLKIYTRTGDEGLTSLFSGGRVSKTHPRVQAYGTVDELNSLLGTAQAAGPQPLVSTMIEKIQHQLFTIGSDLATPAETRSAPRIGSTDTAWLESEIDRMTEALPPLRHFILPGGTPSASQIHVARCVCRRGERLVVLLAEQEPINRETLIYLNRLSDFLFTLARYENFLSGVDERIWVAPAEFR